MEFFLIKGKIWDKKIIKDYFISRTTNSGDYHRIWLGFTDNYKRINGLNLGVIVDDEEIDLNQYFNNESILGENDYKKLIKNRQVERYPSPIIFKPILISDDTETFYRVFYYIRDIINRNELNGKIATIYKKENNPSQKITLEMHEADLNLSEYLDFVATKFNGSFSFNTDNVDLIIQKLNDQVPVNHRALNNVNRIKDLSDFFKLATVHKVS